MKSYVRKRSMSVVLVVTVLALVAPVVAAAEEIPPGPSTSLEDYYGAPQTPGFHRTHSLHPILSTQVTSTPG